MAGLQESFDHIQRLQESGNYRQPEERRSYEREEQTEANSSSGDVSFDDL